VLSVAYQERGVPDNAPSAFRVADFTIGGSSGAPAPKATVPEAEPAPYDGSATVYPLVTATSTQVNFPAQLAADGNPLSFWSSGQATQTLRSGIPWVEIMSAVSAIGGKPTAEQPQTLTIDYGQPRDIERVTVTPGSIGPRTYAIEARVNGAWTKLAEVDGQGRTALTTTVKRTSADAIRLTITAAADSPMATVQVAEVAVDADPLPPVEEPRPPVEEPRPPVEQPRPPVEQPVRDTVKPTLSKTALTAKRVRAGTAARVRFTLSEPAAVRATVQRQLTGRKRGNSCLTGRKTPRKGARCSVWKTAATSRATGKTGANTVTVLSARQSRRLLPGNYRVVLVATDAAGNRSATVRAAFKVAAGR
jgi:hypothetical protein